jgi:hypothetical protein
VYNNVFYTVDTIKIKDCNNSIFYNNIFWANYGEWNNNIFDYNSYYGGLIPPENDTHKITLDPLFINPGMGIIGRESLGGYKLLVGSPCLFKGKVIPDNVYVDFWGNPVPDSITPSIGAFNGAGK